MSLVIVGMVLNAVVKERLVLSAYEQLVLIRMAAYADDDGTNIFPSVATLMKVTGMKRRGLQYAIDALEALRPKLLVRDQEGHRSATARWHIELEPLRKGALYAPFEGWKGRTKQPERAHQTTEKGAPGAPSALSINLYDSVITQSDTHTPEVAAPPLACVSLDSPEGKEAEQASGQSGQLVATEGGGAVTSLQSRKSPARLSAHKPKREAGDVTGKESLRAVARAVKRRNQLAPVKTGWPDGFALTPGMRKVAFAAGIVDADEAFRRFRGDALKHNRRYAADCWGSVAWEDFCLSHYQDDLRRQTTAASGPPADAGKVIAERQQNEAEQKARTPEQIAAGKAYLQEVAASIGTAAPDQPTRKERAS